MEAGFRAYFEFIVEDPAPFAFLRRNLARSAAIEHCSRRRRELAEDLARCAGALGVTSIRAHAMVTVGVELGARMAEREPPDVEGATRFATRALPPRPRLGCAAGRC